jgi:hypothetical protein
MSIEGDGGTVTSILGAGGVVTSMFGAGGALIISSAPLVWVTTMIT